MIKKDHQEIWEWHQHIEAYQSSGMGQKEYCTEFNVDYKKFCNMRYRIEYKMYTHPQLYVDLIKLGRNYIASGSPGAKFAEKNKMSPRILSEVVTHLGYLDIIEKIRQEKEDKPMNFIQVPTVQGALARPPIEPEHQVMEKQNDLEIIISKGVKVSIAPNIDTMKIVKIIEFLKDL